MIEKVIENWLDKADERSLQLAYAHMLSAEGHTIIHISRHCGMEMGKDIIAIAPDGVPCAYQLKAAHGGTITLLQWRNEISGQIEDLVLGAIDHPSVDSDMHHRSYLVTNGKLEEEASRAIQDRNRGWKKRGYKLETIVKWQFLKKAERLTRGFWPLNINLLCDLNSIDPRGALPKLKLIGLFENILPLDNKKAPTEIECERSLATAALLCSLAIAPIVKESNHVAIIEAWTLFASYTVALATRWKLPTRHWVKVFHTALDVIYHSLENLADELRSTGLNKLEHPLELDFYRFRVTWLISLMSIYSLWSTMVFNAENKIKAKTLTVTEYKRWKEEEAEKSDFIRSFCLGHVREMLLWGEAAVPQFITWFWFARKIDSTTETDKFLRNIIKILCDLNRPRSLNALPSPYYEAVDVLSRNLGLGDKPLEDSFDGNSYTLEALVHLFVRQNWKQEMKNLWYDITKLSFATFEPIRKCDFFRWWVRDGSVKYTYPKHTQDWTELRNIADECKGLSIPKIAKEYPFFMLLFICVFPHRMNTDIVRWLDTQLKTI